MKLIRLEASSNSQERQGIYQVLDTYLISDYACEAENLPYPHLENVFDDVEFWFTEVGWEKYGTWFLNLLIEPEAQRELESEGIKFFVCTTDSEIYHNIWVCDEFQVCISTDEKEGWWDNYREINASNLEAVLIDLGLSVDF